MNDVVKVLMEYGLIREVAERIDIEARRTHFKETKIEPFEKASTFALDVRIDPEKYAIKWYLINSRLPTRNEQLSCIVKTHRSTERNTQMCYSDRYRHLVRFEEAARERLGYDSSYDSSYDRYVSKTMNALYYEGRCHYCKEELQIDNSACNNWQHYEDREWYHLTCKVGINPLMNIDDIINSMREYKMMSASIVMR